MGGFYGVVTKDDCTSDLFYGTDYHSHLGTKRGGMATLNSNGFTRFIHNIENTQFRSKFEDDISKLHGASGIGVISDYEDQPLIIGSHLGTYAIVTVGKINNLEALAEKAFEKRATHFSEMSGDEINPTELVATIINRADNFTDGLARVMKKIEGSCSILLLTNEGLYAARDRYGRTPVILGEKEGAYAVTMETCAFPNLDYEVVRDLGPGEVVRITTDGIEQMKKPGKKMQICSFLWVYYGYPASSYEGINAEDARNRCGEYLAANDDTEADIVAGIPDSGTGHGLGYATKSGIPYRRPYVKYTPTWPRSFMPQDQRVRDHVARMKLIKIRDLVENKRLLFCDDSIVRGTQLRDNVQQLFTRGAKEVHMRVACPPLLFGCEYLNFSRSKSELDLATRQAIQDMEGDMNKNIDEYADPCSEKHCAMIEHIRKSLNLTSLKYQKLDDLIAAIGLPKEDLCTYCWTGKQPEKKND